jgi:hypothetical protein
LSVIGKNLFLRKQSKLLVRLLKLSLSLTVFLRGGYKFSEGRETSITDAGIIGYRGVPRDGERFFNHMSALAIRDAIGTDCWQNYFKFTVIRNPFDKMLSAYYWFERARIDLHEPISKQILGFRRWLASEAFNRTYAGMIFDRDKYVIDNEIVLDYFIRFENLPVDIRYVCDQIGIDSNLASLRRLKTGKRPLDINRHHFYDHFSTIKVIKWFAFEFEVFGYPLDP